MSAPNTAIIRPKVPGKNAPEFEEAAQEALERFGYVNLTIFRWVPSRSALKRIYSSDQERFPVDGEKHMPTDAPWPQTMIVKRQPHITRNEDEIRATYNDSASILDAGIGAIFCFPVVIGQETVGAFNFSGAPEKYDEDVKQGLEALVNGKGVQAMEAYLKRVEA